MKVPAIICAASVIVARYTKIVCLYQTFSAVSIYAATFGFKIFIVSTHTSLLCMFLRVNICNFNNFAQGKSK